MEGEEDPGEGRQSLPKALGERERTIKLSDGSGTVIVPKWSWSKAIKVFQVLSSALDEVGEERAEKLKGKNTLEVIGTAIDILGEKMIPLLKVSVRADDADKVTDDLAPEDVIGILEAAIELNMTEGLTKKALGLWRRFVPKKTEKPEK